MWIVPESIHSAFAPGSECSTREPGSPSSISALNPEQLPMRNGKRIQPRSLSRLWKTAPWIRLLFGAAICESSMQARFADWWIASLRDSPARISALPVAGPGSMATGPGYSSQFATSQMIAERGCSFWRTSAPSLLPPPPLWTRPREISKNGRSVASWENWPTAGGMRNGCIYERPMWAPATSGNDGFYSDGESWLTPNTPNGGRAVPPELVASKGRTETGEKRTVGLESQARYWPTPVANDDNKSPEAHLKMKARMKGGPRSTITSLQVKAKVWATPDTNTATYSNGRFGQNLREQAAQWPTPKASHDQGVKSELKRKSPSLHATAATWPTPASRDANGANSAEHVLVTGRGRKHMDQLANFVVHSPQAQQTNDGKESSSNTPGSRRRLNPAFVCLLMGWPWWWTNPGLTSSVRPAMESYRSRQLELLSSLCGDQGPDDDDGRL